jgi:hypothetical protein
MPCNSAFVKPESQYQFRIARAGRMAFEINCLNRSLLNILQDLRIIRPTELSGRRAAGKQDQPVGLSTS